MGAQSPDITRTMHALMTISGRERAHFKRGLIFYIHPAAFLSAVGAARAVPRFHAPVPRAAGGAMGMPRSGGVRPGPDQVSAPKTGTKSLFEDPAGWRRPYGGAGTFAPGTGRAQSTGCWPGTGRLHTAVF